jgi:hypothetical protein
MAKRKDMRESEFRFGVFPCWEYGPSMYELHGVGEVNTNGKCKMISAIEISEVERGMMSSPFAKVKEEDLYALMDAMWQAGIRPTCGEGHIGELNATKEHLADMKKIAFNRLKIN